LVVQHSLRKGDDVKSADLVITSGVNDGLEQTASLDVEELWSFRVEVLVLTLPMMSSSLRNYGDEQGPLSRRENEAYRLGDDERLCSVVMCLPWTEDENRGCTTSKMRDGDNNREIFHHPPHEKVRRNLVGESEGAMDLHR
jgi:hypothetical protein